MVALVWQSSPPASNGSTSITPSLDLPLYNPDREGADAPAAWAEFRDQIRPVDGLLFGSTEYNRSMTGALKNALDGRARGPMVRASSPKSPRQYFRGRRE